MTKSLQWHGDILFYGGLQVGGIREKDGGHYFYASQKQHRIGTIYHDRVLYGNPAVAKCACLLFEAKELEVELPAQTIEGLLMVEGLKAA